MNSKQIQLISCVDDNSSRPFDYEYHRHEVSTTHTTVSPVLPPHHAAVAPQYSPLGHPPLYPVLTSPDQHMYQVS